MPGNDAIRAEGTVVEVLPKMLFRLELPNGHRILAHAAARLRPGLTRVAVGDQLTVEMTPFDMSRGRIRGWNGKNLS